MSLPSRGVNGTRPLLESPVELAGLSLLIALPAKGLGFMLDGEAGVAGIIDTRVPGREVVENGFAAAGKACFLVSGFKGAESGICEIRVLERERVRRDMLGVELVLFTGGGGLKEDVCVDLLDDI